MPDENTFKLPESLPADADTLNELLAQATAAFTARYDAGASTQEDVAALNAAAADVKTLREAVEKIKASDAGVEDDEPALPAEEPEAPAEPAPEPELAAPEEEAKMPHPAEQLLEVFLRANSPAAASTPVPEPAGPVEVVAPAVAPQPASLAASIEDVQLPLSSPNWVILASADVPGTPSGTRIEDKDALVRAVTAKARSLSEARVGIKTPTYQVASFQLPLHNDRWLDGMSEKDAFQALNDLASPEFLKAEMSRTASGGWCAPSETIYGFSCRLEEMDGMVDFPTYGTRRGGVRFPVSPSFADFRADPQDSVWTWTEADDIAAATGAPTKPCFHIPCVDFDEARLELEGLCVTAGNLTDLAYPELIRRYLELVMAAHFHRMNAAKIVKAVAIAGAAVSLAATFGAASSTYSGLLLQVADIRDLFSMGENALIEGIAPRWLRGIMKADYARREGVDLTTVSNADLARYMLDAGVRMQFVSDWQSLGTLGAPATAWPTTVDIILYPAGQIREMTGPSLDIAVARDSVLNETNDFTVAFTEQSYQISAMGGCGQRRVRIPVCPDGSAGSLVDLTCPVA